MCDHCNDGVCCNGCQEVAALDEVRDMLGLAEAAASQGNRLAVSNLKVLARAKIETVFEGLERRAVPAP